jgi:hypothetical protein
VRARAGKPGGQTEDGEPDLAACFRPWRMNFEGVIMRSPGSRRSLLNYIGIFILMVGMGVGEFIYWRGLQGGSGTDDGDPLLSQYDSRLYQRDVQRYVGTFGLIMDQWSRAAAELGQPKPLAITITVISMLAAGGCFMMASRIPRD